MIPRVPRLLHFVLFEECDLLTSGIINRKLSAPTWSDCALLRFWSSSVTLSDMSVPKSRKRR